MKLFHLADLHLGKRVNGFSMLEDQSYVLKQILSLVDLKHPDGVMLCGDIYDKPVPSEEAVRVFDGFLHELSRRNVSTYVIAGNHDSAERLSFGSKLMEGSKVYIADTFRGVTPPIVQEDQLGPVNIYMLPFIKPAMVREAYPDADVHTYQEAVEYVIGKMDVDPKERKILMAHQFVTGAVRSESEDVNVGGLDNVDFEVFDAFDYVALGHIHRPQRVGRDEVRYSGTPLKYSFSEENDNKSLTFVEMNKKGKIRLTPFPMEVLRDMRTLRGTYEEVTARKNYDEKTRQDYIRVILTDEHDVPDAMNKLRYFYPNIMKLEYDNSRTREDREITASSAVEDRTPEELFEDFYLQQNNIEMTEEQKKYTEDLIRQVWEG